MLTYFSDTYGAVPAISPRDAQFYIVLSWNYLANVGIKRCIPMYYCTMKYYLLHIWEIGVRTRVITRAS